MTLFKLYFLCCSTCKRLKSTHDTYLLPTQASLQLFWLINSPHTLAKIYQVYLYTKNATRSMGMNHSLLQEEGKNATRTQAPSGTY